MVDQFLEEGFSLVDTVRACRLLLADVLQFQLFEDEALRSSLDRSSPAR